MERRHWVMPNTSSKNSGKHWGKKYPRLGMQTGRSFPRIPKYPEEVRRLIYTTNAVEGLRKRSEPLYFKP